MTTRMTVRRVTFFRAFRLAGADGIYPPGSYSVETDEDPIEGLSFAAYRRTATYITVPGASAGVSQMVRVEPVDLEVLLSVGLESAIERSCGAELSENSLDALIDDPTMQEAIASTRLTSADFRRMVGTLIEDRRRAAEAAESSRTTGGVRK